MATTYPNRYDSPAFAATPASVRRISWGAVFAGAAVAMAAQLMLNMLGIGLGAGAVDAGASGEAIGAGAIAWLGVTTILAMFAGGWVAGRLAGFPQRLDSSLHGLVAFAVAVLLTFSIVGTAGGAMIRGQSSAMNDMMSRSGLVAPDQAGVYATPQAGSQTTVEEDDTPAERHAENVAAASIGTFITLLIGAAAAMSGACFGTPRQASLARAQVEPVPDHAD